MPTIQTFGSIQIRMYFFDHNPPHFHIVTPDVECKVSIADFSILAGRFARNMSVAIEWAENHQGLLTDTWAEFHGD